MSNYEVNSTMDECISFAFNTKATDGVLANDKFKVNVYVTSDKNSITYTVYQLGVFGSEDDEAAKFIINRPTGKVTSALLRTEFNDLTRFSHGNSLVAHLFAFFITLDENKKELHKLVDYTNDAIRPLIKKVQDKFPDFTIQQGEDNKLQCFLTDAEVEFDLNDLDNCEIYSLHDVLPAKLNSDELWDLLKMITFIKREAKRSGSK